MLTQFIEFLNRITKAKSITLIAIVVILAGFAWFNRGILTEVTFTLKEKTSVKDDSSSQKSNTKDSTTTQDNNRKPRLKLGKILLPPASKKISSFAVFQITNIGSASAEQVRIVIDFGSTIVIAFDVIGPRPNEVIGSPPGQSMLTLEIPHIYPREKVYIYAQTTNPNFLEITVNSSNSQNAIGYTYQEYLASEDPGNKSNNVTFAGAMKFLLGLVIFAIVIYITIVLMILTSRWLKI